MAGNLDLITSLLPLGTTIVTAYRLSNGLETQTFGDLTVTLTSKTTHWELKVVASSTAVVGSTQAVQI